MLMKLSLWHFVYCTVDALATARSKFFFTCFAETQCMIWWTPVSRISFMCFVVYVCVCSLRFVCLMSCLYLCVDWIHESASVCSCLCCRWATCLFPASFPGCSWEVEIRPTDVCLLPGRLLRQTGTRTLADSYSIPEAKEELVWDA